METPSFDFLNAALGWFVREVVEFGLRWLVVAFAVFGFSGWLGYRYRDTKKQLADLKDAMAKRAPDVFLTQAEYDALQEKDLDTLYHISE